MKRGAGGIINARSGNEDLKPFGAGGGRESGLLYFRNSSSHTWVDGITARLRSIGIYSYFNTAPNSPVRRPAPPALKEILDADGGNLLQLLNVLKVNDRPNYRRIIQRLQEINPNFEEIDFFTLGGSMLMMLQEKQLKRAVRTEHISDGTLRFLCLLAIFCNEKRGGIVGIDEPETGLHPDMLRVLTEELTRASETTQFFIATHSEHILSGFGLENILVFEKDDENATVISKYKQDDFGEWAQNYSLGRLWRNGDIGGNRW